MDDLSTVGGASVLMPGLIYSAKIDYITLETPCKLQLPGLMGKAKWPPQHHYRRLTIHDAQFSDLIAMESLYGPIRLLELEIAVDIRPVASLGLKERQSLAERLMVDQLAKQLEPSDGAGMKDHARTFYRRLASGYKVAPFNMRLPCPTDQQLYGWRNDDVQVKAYWKKVDQREKLAPDQHVVRVEVRLSPAGLNLHGLETTADLQNFRFRKSLMPYFRHVQGVRTPKSKTASAMLKLLRDKSSEFDQSHFNAVGVGAFLKGGRRSDQNVLWVRNTGVNNRIGQALMRLERQFSEKNRVSSPLSESENPYLVRPAAWLDKSPMTIYIDQSVSAPHQC
jgi:hypothetical protein